MFIVPRIGALAIEGVRMLKIIMWLVMTWTLVVICSLDFKLLSQLF